MNRDALITGAARGIGHGIARSPAKEGFDLVINDVAPRTSISAKLTALEQDGVQSLPVPLVQIKHNLAVINYFHWSSAGFESLQQQFLFRTNPR